MSDQLMKIEKTVNALQSIKGIKKATGTYLVCDVSGSMAGEKIESLITAVNQLQFPFNRIVSFSWDVSMGLRTHASGTTALHKALAYVYNLECKKIILISDGRPDSISGVMEILRKDIPIDIVFISGYGDQNEGKAFMEELASLTNGSSFVIEDYKNNLEAKLITSIKGYLSK